MKIKSSMRNKLILAIFIGCLIPYFSGGLYLNMYIENRLYNESIENSNQVLYQVSELIDKTLMKDMKEEVSMLASLDCVKSIEKGINNYIYYKKDSFAYQNYEAEYTIAEYFRNVKESHETTNFIFLATKTGGYMEYPQFSPSKSYDPRVRPWYLAAVNHEEAYISEPYITSVSKEMVISFTKQIKSEDEVIGVVGISVNLSDLSSTIGRMKVGDSGYILVLSPLHKFVFSSAHPEWILKTPMECGLKDFTEDKLEKEKNFTTIIDGKESVVNCVSEDNGWHIISVSNKAEILSSAREVTKILTGIYVITFLLVIVILWHILNRFTEPILNISSVIKRMSDFKFDDDESIRSYSRRFDEIGTVSKAFMEMQNKINQYFEEITNSNLVITTKNDLLIATEEELTAQLEEISHQKDYIDFLAYHDPLTELPNRRKFIQILTNMVKQDQKGAVILLDLDDFKDINDVRGHVFGDQVLATIAKRLVGVANNRMIVSRFGGDEFLILVEIDQDKVEIDVFIRLINQLFDEKVNIDGNEIEIHYSMGIAVFPDDSVDVNQLIMEADLAMYSVKNSGKNGYQYFDDNMMKYQLKISNIENILREAVKSDGFKLVYQPMVEIKSGRIVSYEALLRLKEYSMSPVEFIEIAEKNGLILTIGRIVTERAIQQMYEWRKAGMDLKPISINFSANQLHDREYVNFIQELLEKYEIESKFIEIEITENIFLENKQIPLEFLRKLKDLGVSIAIDDFGTGYSSLNYLTFLPVDIVKLDRSLNMKFLEISNVKVMDSLISLVHSLGLMVVAEGIETLEQVKTLRRAECDFIQGYYFSKPLEAEKILEINDIIYKF